MAVMLLSEYRSRPCSPRALNKSDCCNAKSFARVHNKKRQRCAVDDGEVAGWSAVVSKQVWSGKGGRATKRRQERGPDE